MHRQKTLFRMIKNYTPTGRLVMMSWISFSILFSTSTWPTTLLVVGLVFAVVPSKRMFVSTATTAGSFPLVIAFVLLWLWPAWPWARSYLHIGHVDEKVSSHFRTQAAWKVCPQWGSAMYISGSLHFDPTLSLKFVFSDSGWDFSAVIILKGAQQIEQPGWSATHISGVTGISTNESKTSFGAGRFWSVLIPSNALVRASTLLLNSSSAVRWPLIFRNRSINPTLPAVGLSAAAFACCSCRANL